MQPNADNLCVTEVCSHSTPCAIKIGLMCNWYPLYSEHDLFSMEDLHYPPG